MPGVWPSKNRGRREGAPRPHDFAVAVANIPVSRRFRIINFATFGGEAEVPNHSVMVRVAMPHNLPSSSIPEPVNAQGPVDDFFASRLADRIRMDSWREKLTIIRGEILEIAEQGSEHGLADLKRETLELARTLERLETLLGLAAK